MGAGASFQEGNSLANRKFRKLILLKAYNKRDRNISVRQQFVKLAHRYSDSEDVGRHDSHPGFRSSDTYILTSELLRELGMGDEQMKAMCKRFDVHVDEKIEFGEFMHFMEHGGQQCCSPTHAHTKPTVEDKREAAGKVLFQSESRPEVQTSPLQQKEVKQEDKEEEKQQEEVESAGTSNQETNAEPPSPEPTSVEELKGEKAGTATEATEEEELEGEVLMVEPVIEEPESEDEADDKTKEPTLVKKVVLSPEDVTTLTTWEEREAWEPDKRNLWKKREIIVNERTTEYTKVDELGVAQVLVECEKTQYEVLHMENKEGEFAHKETNTFEQYEKFNDELVMHETGNDNLVHLKSHEDEVSHHWSEGVVPNKDGEGEGEGQGQEGAEDAHAHAPPGADGEHAGAGPGEGQAGEMMANDAVAHPNWLDNFKTPYHKILFFLEEKDMLACTIVCKSWCVSIIDFVRFMQELQQEEQMMMEGGGAGIDGFEEVEDEDPGYSQEQLDDL